MPELIFEDKERHLVIQRGSNYTPQFVNFLQHIVWGSGGVQYTLHNVANILNRLKHPQFFSMTQDGQLVAVTTLNKKTVNLGGETYPAIYSYGIAVLPSKRGLGYGTLMAEQRLQYGLAQIGNKGLFYGYIEAGNTNSLKTNTKVGSKSIGQYHILLISRLRPKEDAWFQRLKETEKERVVHLLSKLYKNHALVDFEQSVEVEDYYILKQGEEIVAGLQCERHQLSIKHLPGVSGLMLVKMVPHIPILGRLFPDRNFHFLTFGNIYIKKGMETEIFAIMEALLARHHLNFGMIYMDKRSPVYQLMTSVGNYGIFNALIDVPVHVMAFFKNFSESEIADLRRQPLFISMDDPV
ncbi:MAG: GNAT family N-acetyltransferase [Thermodesulfobacteriota bacterium]